MRIILADPYSRALWALKTAVQEYPEFELAGEATNAEELLKIAGQHPADLVLVDMKLPGKTIEELIAVLHSLEERPIVIVMSTRTEAGRRALSAGADGFVSKGDEPVWLLDSLRRYAARTAHKRDST